jgi:HAD superfamily hydrolase (TIGR01509 family)
MLRAVIFDFDGLILDTEVPEYMSWCELYESYGQTLPLETWCLAVGTRNGFDPYAHLESLVLKPVDRAVVRLNIRARTKELLTQSAPLPGVIERLDEARSLGLGVAIASSSDHADVYPHLERHGIVPGIQAVVCAATDGLAAKPDPALYLEALRLLDVAAHEAIAFEDSRNGVTAAKVAGIACVAVPNEITKGMDLSHADAILPSLAGTTLAALAAQLGL